MAWPFGFGFVVVWLKLFFFMSQIYAALNSKKKK